MAVTSLSLILIANAAYGIIKNQFSDISSHIRPAYKIEQRAIGGGENGYEGLTKYSHKNIEPLWGLKVSDLNAKILGVEDNTVIGKELNTDFEKNLEKLWQEKLRKSKGNGGVSEIINNQVKSYSQKDATHMTIEQYINEIDVVVNDINDNLDWNKAGELRGLSSQRKRSLVENISKSFDGTDILAYGLTELMPTKNGMINKAVLDTLLRKAGREYIELIPALHDKKTSFGPFQFTEYAIFHADEIRGASIINQALPEEYRIPGSVINLKGNDHFKAAQLFAINNISYLVENLNERELSVLEEVWKEKKSDLVEYIATAHHLPVVAKNTAKRWLQNNAEYPFWQSSSNKACIDYAFKTRSNRKALLIEGIPNVLVDEQVDRRNKGKFIKEPFKNSKGETIFSYIVKKEDNPSNITEKFNEWDLEQGDNFSELGYNKVVSIKGNPVGVIKPGNKIYIQASSLEKALNPVN
ncbi:hypothetical protein GOV08_02570 [Candidatus Woesearchaeota archaeon]|nr:hypothetical protein [Candidatus Woesearchaeota archaeon]